MKCCLLNMTWLWHEFTVAEVICARSADQNGQNPGRGEGGTLLAPPLTKEPLGFDNFQGRRNHFVLRMW